MSGGSLDYVYDKVEDAADTVAARATTPLHFAFADHLRLVSKALHDLEWMLSGDTGPGDEEAAIRAVLTPAAEIQSATARAEAAVAELTRVLAQHAPPA